MLRSLEENPTEAELKDMIKQADSAGKVLYNFSDKPTVYILLLLKIAEHIQKH